MSAKTLLVGLLVAAVDSAEAKEMRALTPVVQASSNNLLRSQERTNKQPMVTSCASPLVESGHAPIVAAGTCQAQCLFQDDDNEWCFKTTSPVLTTGWNFVQNSGSNFFQLKFMPYF